MQMLLQVTFPHEEFNAAVCDGTIEQKIKRILDETKPQAVYFTEYEGHRSALLLIDLPDPSKVPALAEPWFLLFNADCRFHIVMTPDVLEKAGLGALGKKWA